MDKYILEKLKHRISEIERFICQTIIPVTELKYEMVQDNPEFRKKDFKDSQWKPLFPDQEWGGRDEVLWVRGTIKIPQSFVEEAIDLSVEAGPKETADIKAEVLLYVDGEELCAFDNWHSKTRLSETLKGRRQFQIALRCWSGMNENWQKRHFKGIYLEIVHEDTEKFYYLTKVLLETIQELGLEDYRAIRLTQMLDEAFLSIDYLSVGEKNFYKNVSEAYSGLSEKLMRLATDVSDKPTVAVCGHTHIDMAWLWRLEHTREKGVRSFATVLNLMEQYPEYKFSQSSPLLYEMIYEKYPKIFKRIKEKIREGRWEVTGGMWVEPDTNIPSGESLVRQLLLGKTYVREAFGKEMTVVWLPDVFGYSWVLPQILKKSGIKLFWTNKMSWNQYNRIPYDTFLWRGMDGSELLTQLGTCPERDVTWGSTYNGVIAPWEVKGTWDKYQQKDINNEVLMPFGWGDGGGGPTREMLESYRIMRNLPGLPRVEMKHIETFADDLLQNLEQKKIPVWDGELYFEYHRGTYTSQAFVKRANRKSEILYHDVEFFNTLYDVLAEQKAYPEEQIRKNWKRICTNQFHDILPGSAIEEVYEDAKKSYEDLQEEGQLLLDRALSGIAEIAAKQENDVIVFNSLPWKRDGVFTISDIPEGMVLTDGEFPVLGQFVRTGDKSVEYYVKDIPACGYKRLFWKPGNGDRICERKRWDCTLENRYYKIYFNETGQIVRLYDKEYERNVITEFGLGNELCVFEDKPHQFDAWNTEIYAYDKYEPVQNLTGTKLEKGQEKTVLYFTYQFRKSKIYQKITLYEDRREIYFDTKCEWYEKNALLKTSFDVEIRSTYASYDIQFGNLKRPTHSNTSWDYAQFEVCAHKWADLSEGNYGVALLNDCKYGYDIKNNKMRLTLIKTSSYPDPKADIGIHEFSYALLPHGGTWEEGNVHRAAYEFNYPLHVQIAKKVRGNEHIINSFISTESKNIVIETVKKAENENAWIIRVYECMNCRKKVRFHFGLPLQKAWECTLMEEVQDSLETDGNSFSCEVAPYEIKTFKVHFAY